MNNTVYGQMQMDVMNTANNMVIQQVCAEKGIDYNQLMMCAQQQHINGIMAQAQQRMIMKEVKRHYQGDSWTSKVRDFFGGNSSADMMNPMMFPGFMPQQPMVQPMQPMYQQPMMQQPMYQQPMQQAMVPPTAPAAGEIPLSNPADNNERMDMLEADVKRLNVFLEQLAQRLQEGAKS